MKLTKEQRDEVVNQVLIFKRPVQEVANEYCISRQNVYNLINAKKRAFKMQAMMNKDGSIFSYKEDFERMIETLSEFVKRIEK